MPVDNTHWMRNQPMVDLAVTFRLIEGRPGPVGVLLTGSDLVALVRAAPTLRVGKIRRTA